MDESRCGIKRPIGLSQNALARAIDVSPRRINEIVQGKRALGDALDRIRPRAAA